MGNGLLDLPMKFLMPSSCDNIKEIAFKTVPSASKVDIKRVLESTYGFEVKKVRTLNMQGKKKRRSGRLIARPNYKKAYVTLKNPKSFASDVASQGLRLEELCHTFGPTIIFSTPFGDLAQKGKKFRSTSEKL